LSHEVHCPLFPDVKQEYWWVYICDRKSQTLLTTPIHVTSLAQFEEIQLRFTAPRWPGLYTFTVCLRSDSYLGFDQAQDIKVSYLRIQVIQQKNIVFIFVTIQRYFIVGREGGTRSTDRTSAMGHLG